MAAIVYHGLQSHLKSQLVESRTLKLRFPPSKPTPPPQLIDLTFKSCFWDSNSSIKSNNEETSDKSTPSNPNSWSFVEALSDVTKESSQKETTATITTYMHPQQKRSSLRLSPKSLELCTENLGNESGTDIAEDSIDMLCSGNSATREQTQRQPRQLSTAEKAKTHNFPPPLTTIRGSESLRVRPHRENGRLVIEVTKVPQSVSCFQAQRSHGRLRLSFLTNHTPSFDREEDDDVEENEPLANGKEYESDIIGQVKDVEEQEVEITTETGEEEECVACGSEESDIIVPRRCKEGGDHENLELLLIPKTSLLVS